MRRLPLVGILGALAALCGCASLAGNGEIIEERRNVPPFTEVKVANGFVGEVTQVPAGAAEGTWLRGDSNLLPRVALVVRDGVLSMRLPDDVALMPSKPFVLAVEAVVLDGVLADEGATIEAEAIQAARFRAEARSGSKVVVKGPGVDALDVVSRAGSKADTGELPAAKVNAAVSEGSKATVRATQQLDAVVASGSSLKCLGQPAVRNVESKEGSSVTFE